MQHGPAASSGSNPKAPGSAGGYLLAYAESDGEFQGRVAAFRQELRKLGWSQGGSLRIDERWTADDMDRVRAYATELINLAFPAHVDT
jgi:hypothetical protein